MRGKVMSVHNFVSVTSRPHEWLQSKSWRSSDTRDSLRIEHRLQLFGCKKTFEIQ